MQDELIERLGGVDAVAEMSGRKRRMVKQPNGSYKYCLRSSGEIALEKVHHSACHFHLVLTYIFKLALCITTIINVSIIFTSLICITIFIIINIPGVVNCVACISIVTVFDLVPIPVT